MSYEKMNKGGYKNWLFKKVQITETNNFALWVYTRKVHYLPSQRRGYWKCP